MQPNFIGVRDANEFAVTEVEVAKLLEVITFIVAIRSVVKYFLLNFAED